MNTERFILSKASEVFDEELQDTKILPTKKVATSTSLSRTLSIANNAHYDCVISERTHAIPKNGKPRKTQNK